MKSIVAHEEGLGFGYRQRKRWENAQNREEAQEAA